LDDRNSKIGEKRKLDKPYGYNNLSGLADFLFWLYKQNLDLVEEATVDRRRMIGLLERIAADMDGMPRLVVVVHEDEGVEESGAVEPMVAEELDSGFWSSIRKTLKL
jgi:hypothetical protein